MEHEEMDLAQKIRQQLDLPPLAKSPAPIGFEDVRKGPKTMVWETSAAGGAMADAFRREWDEYIKRLPYTSSDLAFARPPSPQGEGFGAENIRAAVEQLRKMERERMLYGSAWLRVVPSEHITREVQARRHRKKRINKKWRKRYGMKRVPDTEMMLLGEDLNGERVLLAHPKRVEKLMAQLEKHKVTGNGDYIHF